MESGTNPSDATSLELCLDFADTVDWRKSDAAKETLSNYGDLVAWGRKKGLLGQGQAERLEKLARANGSIEEEVMREAYRLREAIFRVFSASAHERRADPRDVEILNEYLAKGSAKMMVQPTGKGFRWAWRDDSSADLMLFPVARSAADLLTSEDLARVKECANEEQGCGWLFLDSSKSQTRKWCSMESCGNRMKFRAYYDRHNRPRSA